jgi:hypothetical protein
MRPLLLLIIQPQCVADLYITIHRRFVYTTGCLKLNSTFHLDLILQQFLITTENKWTLMFPHLTKLILTQKPTCELKHHALYTPNIHDKGKGKATPLQAWTGPKGSRT